MQRKQKQMSYMFLPLTRNKQLYQRKNNYDYFYSILTVNQHKNSKILQSSRENFSLE